MVAADAGTALIFSLYPRQAHNAPEGRKLLHSLDGKRANPSLVADHTYEGDGTRHR